MIITTHRHDLELKAQQSRHSQEIESLKAQHEQNLCNALNWLQDEKKALHKQETKLMGAKRPDLQKIHTLREVRYKVAELQNRLAESEF